MTKSTDRLKKLVQLHKEAYTPIEEQERKQREREQEKLRKKFPEVKR